MSTTDVQIANMALSRLGQTKIMSLTQAGKNPELCNQYFESTRDELLASNAWDFALKRASLAAVSGDTLNKFTYKYQLPLNPKCLKVITLIDAANGTYEDIPTEWIHESGLLYTDETPASIKYIEQITNPTFFPGLFTEALALRLASKICMSITQDVTLFQLIIQEFTIANENAKQQEGSWSRYDDMAEQWWSE